MRRGIFVGYRRDDTADVAGRICDALSVAFGDAQVFKDVDSMPVGADFAAHIRAVLPKCRVFLALLGPNWLDARASSGARRLDDPSDLVRVEIETALRTSKLLVVPVLINGAGMPTEAELPEAMRPLVRRHAAILRRDPDFHNDISRLVSALREHVLTGRLNLQTLGGAARVAANAAEISFLVALGWLGASGALVTMVVPQWREQVLQVGETIVGAANSQLGIDYPTEKTIDPPQNDVQELIQPGSADVVENLDGSASADANDSLGDDAATSASGTLWEGQFYRHARLGIGFGAPFTMQFVLQMTLNADGSVESNWGTGQWAQDGNAVTVVIDGGEFAGLLEGQTLSGTYSSPDYAGSFSLEQR